MSTYHFLPWVRSGMARLITAPDLGNEPSGQSGRISLPVTVTLEAKKTDGKTSHHEVRPKDGSTSQDGDPPQLYGPGDVIGIDMREIIRTGPLPLTPDYPPERFAFIEFDRPDFPWLFTPGAQSQDRLHPWLILVVVEKSQATITPPVDNKLPVLSCPITELPPTLNESWAWAHAVYAGDASLDHKTVETKLHTDPPDRNLSRLLCPRKLKAHIPYEACLVPAFTAGVKAGLGEDFDPNQVPLAHWKFEKAEQVKLPVYYHWSFSTGEKDQFIKLAQQLQPLSTEEKEAALQGIAGDMDISDPGNGMKASKDKLTVSIPSALRISTDETSSSTSSLPAGFDQDALQTLLTTPPEMKDGSMPLPLPTYGSWHAPPAEPSTQLERHLWLKTLNLDPRYRVAAALGTSIIQKEQEHIVAAVWKAVGELQAVNEFLQRKQLACCVTESIHKKRLPALSPYTFLQMTEPAPLPATDPLNSTKSGFRQFPHAQMKRTRSRSGDAVAKAGTSAPSAQQTDEPLTNFAVEVLADRPVAYYRFNERLGSTTVRDSSGHNHQGTVSATGVKLGVPSISRLDFSAEFEGRDYERVLIPSTPLLSPRRVTLEAVMSWGGPTTGPDGPIQQRIVEKSFTSANPSWPTYALSVTHGGSVLFELIMSDPHDPKRFLSGSLLSTDQVPLGVPMHVAGTYDGTTVCLYINGVLDRTQTVVGDLYVEMNIPSDVAIGNHFNYPRAFKGLLDELAIYDHALSAERMRAHALAVQPLTPLEQVSIVPQFRRMTRAGRSWSIKGNIGDYDPDRIAPPPGMRAGDRSVSGENQAKRSTTVAKAARTDLSHLDRLKQAWLTRTNPRMTFPEEVADRIRRPSQPHLTKVASQEERFDQHGDLGPFTYAPSFPKPMYEPLRDEFPEMLLPGLDKIPNDRATTLSVDAPFIEAYMVGLNHELSREFLWREFPTMLNVTYFRQFWELGDAKNSQAPDLSSPIVEWENKKDGKPLNLGDHLAEGRGGELSFLLIRSELVVRYPHALIYARKTEKRSDGQGDSLSGPLLPVLQFSPITGVALFGFTIERDDVKNWRFFVEEHFTEPYMGDPKDPDASDAPDGAYVSFSDEWKTSAEIASNILLERFYREIKVVKDSI